MGIFKRIKNKLFGSKKRKSKFVWSIVEPSDSGDSEKDVVVNTDVAFYKSELHRLEKIKEKIDPIEFGSLEFSTDLDDYTLELLSPDAKSKIIEIIKEDNAKRALERTKSPGVEVWGNVPDKKNI